MPMNEDRRGPGCSEAVSAGVSSCLAVTDQAVCHDGPLPPLGVKLTCYRLLNVTTVILWAIPKAVLTYKNRSVAGTTLDLLAALCGVALYWVGLFEERRGRNWERFFQVDLAPAFGHSAKRVVGVVVSALSALGNVLVILPLIFVSLLLAVFIFSTSGRIRVRRDDRWFYFALGFLSLLFLIHLHSGIQSIDPWS